MFSACQITFYTSQRWSWINWAPLLHNLQYVARNWIHQIGFWAGGFYPVFMDQSMQDFIWEWFPRLEKSSKAQRVLVLFFPKSAFMRSSFLIQQYLAEAMIFNLDSTMAPILIRIILKFNDSHFGPKQRSRSSFSPDGK